jgi:hypothetical protein
MRSARSFGVLVWGFSASLAGAQQAIGTAQQTMGPNQSVIVAIMQPVAAEPYRAEKTTQSKWTLGDGTVISRETRGTIARDAEGRVREELYQTHSGSMDGHEVDMALQSATVGDPTTHTILFWSGGMGKIAMRMELPSLPAGALATLGSAPPVILRTPPPPGPPLSPAAAARMAEAIATMPAGTPTIVLKDLGTPNNNMPNMGMPTSTSAPTVRALKETSPPPGVGSGTLTVLQPPVFLGSGGAKDNVRIHYNRWIWRMSARIVSEGQLRYNPAEIEPKWQARWDADASLYAAEGMSRRSRSSIAWRCCRIRAGSCTWGMCGTMRLAMRWRGLCGCAGTTCCTRWGGTRSGCRRRMRR